MIQDNCLITGNNGALATSAGTDLSTQADIEALVARIAGAKKVALHIHGGLVSESAALAAAEVLKSSYSDAGIFPVFVIWKTGPLETLGNMLENLFKEDLFSILVRRVGGFVARKLGEGIIEGILPRSPDEPLPAPNDMYATREFQKRRREQEPFKALAPAIPTDVTTDEEEQFKQELSQDGEFLEAAEKAARWVQDHRKGGVDPTFAARGVESESKQSMIDEDLLVQPQPAGGLVRSRGFFSAATLIARIAKVGYRVVKRFVQKRDHGAYATIVEEILRECYVTEFGEKVWGTMKRNAEETFRAAAEPRGGRIFLEEFAKLRPDKRPALSIVAHSAGAIYSCHLAKYVASEKGKSFPADFTFADVTFLAPACSFKLFRDTHAIDPSLFKNLRMFALNDTLESGYWEVKVIYPRSLLYMVSGAFEREDDDATGAFDLPILGMQRYFELPVYGTTDMAVVAAVRRLLAGKTYWSVHDGGEGLRVNSQKHGEFFLGEEKKAAQVLQSVIFTMKQGL